jgi:pimeloyl-ACP methyl ester carboxylesterase
MQIIKSRKIQVGDLNIRYYTGGKGEPLLIIHGGNSHGRLWTNNVKELCEKYTVYIPDLPGFGGSQPMTGQYYVPEFVRFVAGFTQTLGLKTFYLMGHSMGGAIAVSYTLQYPQQVKKLILIDSMCLGKEIALWVRLFSNPAFCRSLGKGLVTLFKGIKWVVEGVFHSMEFIIPVCEASLVIGCAAVSFKSQTTVLAHKLSKIVTPTLILWGDSDRIVPMKQAYAAAAVIPDCRVKILRGGHSAYASNNIEFSGEVHRFLEG